MREGLISAAATELGTKKPPAKHDLCLRVLDHLSQESILIDSGAAVSVFPPHMPRVANMAKISYTRAVKSGKRMATLRVANEAPIETLGTKMVPLCLGNHTFEHNAVVGTPILGWDSSCASTN